MKSSINFYLLISIFYLLISSCDEVGPQIDFSGTHTGELDSTKLLVDSTTSKHVLIEEFTAVRCPNCPQGTTIIDGLLNDYPGRLDVIEIHSGVLANPILSSDPDLKKE